MSARIIRQLSTRGARVNSSCLAPVLADFLSLPVLAQSSNPYDGSWTVSFDGTTRTSNLEGTVVVKDDGGTWMGGPCR